MRGYGIRGTGIRGYEDTRNRNTGYIRDTKNGNTCIWFTGMWGYGDVEKRGYGDTEIRGHKDTGRDTRIRLYEDTKIREYNDMAILGKYEGTETRGYGNMRIG